MKLILLLILITLWCIAFWYMAGAMPSDNETDQWEMNKIDKELSRYEN